MTDPGAAVHAEVERGMSSMIEQHSAWLELCAAGVRGEEYDWRSAEVRAHAVATMRAHALLCESHRHALRTPSSVQLLSCLRAIEWDLQDLEDQVAIVEGNPSKFDLDGAMMEARRHLIDSVRKKVDSVRESVQQAATSEGGHATSAKKAGVAMPGLSKAVGYGKLDEREQSSGACGGGGDASPLVGPDSASFGVGADGRRAVGAAAGGIARQGAPMPADTADAPPEGRRRARWWLWCC